MAFVQGADLYTSALKTGRSAPVAILTRTLQNWNHILREGGLMWSRAADRRGFGKGEQ
jgi:hypothetical protein